MTDPVIQCPYCGREVKLTETLAQPFIDAARKKLEQESRERDALLAKREAALRDAEAAVKRAENQVDAIVAEKVKAEREAIAAAEAKKARDTLGDEIAKVRQEKAETEALLRQRDAKLAEAQKTELELRRDRQKLQEVNEQFELQLQRAIDAERGKIREAASKDAADQFRLKEADKDKVIADLREKINELQRKAEQGSQQRQGEVLELELEALLRTNFPRDAIEPVPKGAFGGDVLHRVIGPLAQPCGTILWEFKRTKNWSDGWLAKLREDQRAAKAEAAVIVSQTMPKGVEAFDLIEGVWVAHPRCAIPVGMAVRQMLVEVASARQATQGQQTKMELVYQYLTGPRFRLRVQAIVEAFSTMQEDLDKERKAIMKQWEKRREQLDHVMQATVGMYGDLHGIAGKSLQEIEGLEMKMLEAPDPMM